MTQLKPQKRPASGWCLALSYLSSLLLTILTVLLVLAAVLCNKNALRRAVHESEFGNAAYALLTDNYASYASATGFDPSVLIGQISPDQIEADMQASVDSLYAGQTAFDLRNQISNATYDAMKADLESRGVNITDTVRGGLVIVADACRNDYASYVSVPLASQLYTLVCKVRGLLWPALLFVALCCLLALVLAVKLAPAPRAGMRCLVFAFATAAALCLLVSLLGGPALSLLGTKLEPASIRLLVLSYLRFALSLFGLFGTAYGAVALALLGWIGMARSTAKRRNRRVDAPQPL